MKARSPTALNVHQPTRYRFPTIGGESYQFISTNIVLRYLALFLSLLNSCTHIFFLFNGLTVTASNQFLEKLIFNKHLNKIFTDDKCKTQVSVKTVKNLSSSCHNRPTPLSNVGDYLDCIMLSDFRRYTFSV